MWAILICINVELLFITDFEVWMAQKLAHVYKWHSGCEQD